MMTIKEKMNPNKIARTVGILFIIGTVAGILSLVFTGPILDDPNYLTKAAANETQLIIGALFILIMGFSLSMLPVMLFPIFKKENEALALGAVVFRGALEAVAYIAIVISMLLLLTVSREYVNAGAPDASYFQTLGTISLEAGVWFGSMLNFVFSLGALMIYYLFYKTNLIPRWLSVWGLIGGLLYFAEPVLAMFGAEFEILFVPLAVQEMVLALWLIVKGFNPSAIASSSVKTDINK